MAFVVTAGQLQAVQRAPVAYYSTPPLSTVAISATETATYDQLWRAQPALRTVVDFLARNVAQLGLDAYRKLSPTDRVKATDHPVARLLERPWQGTKWTKYRLLNAIMHDLCIYDDAYVIKLRLEQGGAPRALMPMSPRMISPTGESPFIATTYTIIGNAGQYEIDAADVIHIHGYNGLDARRGVSPIETLRQILAEEYAATTYRERLWQNGARVSGMILRPKDAPKWSDPARERFENSWRSLYSGQTSNGGTPLLEDGMTFVPSGVTPKDAQYVESRKLTREEVAVAYHVSPVMIGLMDGATFSNVTELHKMLYQDTLAPYLTQISQDLENQLLEDIDPSSVDGSVYIEFNLSEKLRGSFAEQAQAMQSAVGGPWMTRTEARASFNLPHIDEADELIVPLNVTSGGLASPNDTAPNDPSGNGKSAADVLRNHYARQRQVLLARCGAGGEVAYDSPRWTRELSDDAKSAGIEIDATAVDAKTLDRWRTVPIVDGDRRATVRRIFDELTEEIDR